MPSPSGGDSAPRVQNVCVAVRVKPLTEAENTSGSGMCLRVKGDQITIKHPQKDDKKHSFTYDMVFDSTDHTKSAFADQATVFKKLGPPMLDNVFQGFNCSIFAYGQTGSGKSYTMMGEGMDTHSGFIPRFCNSLFREINVRTEAQGGKPPTPARKKGEDSDSSDEGEAPQEIDLEAALTSTTDRYAFKVEASYMEIYNERVWDLLGKNAARRMENKEERNSSALKIREHPKTGPYVEGLNKVPVSSYEDIKRLIRRGNKARSVAATAMNERSSRSHAIFTLRFTQTTVLAHGAGATDKHSRVDMVDLAGSERVSKSKAAGQRLLEAGSINRSLLTLGNVITALADASNEGKTADDTFIPYRDSVLTWLLKDTLGGNAITAMVAAISPSALHYEETMSTLRYADRTKQIKNTATINEDPNQAIIRMLREEVARLKRELEMAKSGRQPITPKREVVVQKIIEDNPATLKEIAGLRVKNSIQTYMLRKRGTEGDKEHGGGGGGGGASYYEEGEDGAPVYRTDLETDSEGGSSEEHGQLEDSSSVDSGRYVRGRTTDVRSSVGTRVTAGQWNLVPDVERSALDSSISDDSSAGHPDDAHLPYLQVLLQDAQFSGAKHFLKEGENWLGSDADSDIILPGATVLPYHCRLVVDYFPVNTPTAAAATPRSVQGCWEVTVIPEPGAQVHINGEDITEGVPPRQPVTLFPGSRLVIGSQHFVRLIDPLASGEAAQLQDAQWDYGLAKEEFLSEAVADGDPVLTQALAPRLSHAKARDQRLPGGSPSSISPLSPVQYSPSTALSDGAAKVREKEAARDAKGGHGRKPSAEAIQTPTLASAPPPRRSEGHGAGASEAEGMHVPPSVRAALAQLESDLNYERERREAAEAQARVVGDHSGDDSASSEAPTSPGGSAAYRTPHSTVAVAGLLTERKKELRDRLRREAVSEAALATMGRAVRQALLMVNEANAMARSLGKPVRFSVALVPKDYPLSASEQVKPEEFTEERFLSLQPDVGISVRNRISLREALVASKDMGVLLDALREHYHTVVEYGPDPSLPPSCDPFYIPPAATMVGRSLVSLSPMLSLLPLDGGPPSSVNRTRLDVDIRDINGELRGSITLDLLLRPSDSASNIEVGVEVSRVSSKAGAVTRRLFPRKEEKKDTDEYNERTLWFRNATTIIVEWMLPGKNGRSRMFFASTAKYHEGFRFSAPQALGKPSPLVADSGFVPLSLEASQLVLASEQAVLKVFVVSKEDTETFAMTGASPAASTVSGSASDVALKRSIGFRSTKSLPRSVASKPSIGSPGLTSPPPRVPKPSGASTPQKVLGPGVDNLFISVDLRTRNEDTAAPAYQLPDYKYPAPLQAEWPSQSQSTIAAPACVFRLPPHLSQGSSRIFLVYTIVQNDDRPFSLEYCDSVQISGLYSVSSKSSEKEASAPQLLAPAESDQSITSPVSGKTHTPFGGSSAPAANTLVGAALGAARTAYGAGGDKQFFGGDSPGAAMLKQSLSTCRAHVVDAERDPQSRCLRVLVEWKPPNQAYAQAFHNVTDKSKHIVALTELQVSLAGVVAPLFVRCSVQFQVVLPEGKWKLAKVAEVSPHWKEAAPSDRLFCTGAGVGVNVQLSEAELARETQKLLGDAKTSHHRLAEVEEKALSEQASSSGMEGESAEYTVSDSAEGAEVKTPEPASRPSLSRLKMPSPLSSPGSLSDTSPAAVYSPVARENVNVSACWPVAFRGYLKKRRKMMGGWVKRWFVFRPPFLACFKSNASPRGHAASVPSIVEESGGKGAPRWVVRSPKVEKSRESPCEFTIWNDRYSWKLQAPSEHECDSWVSALLKYAQ